MVTGHGNSCGCCCEGQFSLAHQQPTASRHTSVMHAASSHKRDAAAAALSSAAEESSKRSRADGEATEAAASQSEPGPACGLCSKPFALEAVEGKPDRTPRVLACGHTYCTTCLARLLDDREMHCPWGCAAHAIQLPKDIAAASITSPMEWARLIPLNHGMLAVMRQAVKTLTALRHQMAAAPAAAAAPTAAAAAHAAAAAAFAGCVFPKCAEAATLHCTDCELDYCAKHDRTLHAQLSHAASVPMHAKAEAVQQSVMRHSIEPAAAQYRNRMKHNLERVTAAVAESSRALAQSIAANKAAQEAQDRARKAMEQAQRWHDANIHAEKKVRSNIAVAMQLSSCELLEKVWSDDHEG